MTRRVNMTDIWLEEVIKFIIKNKRLPKEKDLKYGVDIIQTFHELDNAINISINKILGTEEYVCVRERIKIEMNDYFEEHGQYITDQEIKSTRSGYFEIFKELGYL